MTRQQAVIAAITIVEDMREQWVPNYKTRYKKGGSTGNMAFNALEYSIKNGVLDITVNSAIAPYVPYTNEPWLSPQWGGKPNPNEGWWQRFAAEFARRLAIKLQGELK